MLEITNDFIKEVHESSDLLVTESELTTIFDNLSAALQRDLYDENPIFVCCMNGGMLATSEIVKRLTMPLQIDYVHATRYRKNEGGILDWIKYNNINFKGRTVVLVDDILDGGVTLSEVKNFYEKNGAAKVLTAVMLNKLTSREEGGLPAADYVGYNIEDRYLYGFGLDYHGYLRNIPAIHAVDKKHMV